MENFNEYKGYNGTLVLGETGVTIKRGVRSFLLGGGKLRGDKDIPYSSITAVQLKKAGMTAGYLQLTLKGGGEAKGGLLQASCDENSVSFYKSKNSIFEEAKNIINRHITSGFQQSTSSLDDLEQLSSLKDKGIITQEEFDAKKKSILGL